MTVSLQSRLDHWLPAILVAILIQRSRPAILPASTPAGSSFLLYAGSFHGLQSGRFTLSILVFGS